MHCVCGELAVTVRPLPQERNSTCQGINQAALSHRGPCQTDPHVSGNAHAVVIGKDATVRDSKHESAAPYLSHANFVANTGIFWRDLPVELYFANANRATFAR